MFQTTSAALRAPARRPAASRLILGRGSAILALLLAVGCSANREMSAPPASEPLQEVVATPYPGIAELDQHPAPAEQAPQPAAAPGPPPEATTTAYSPSLRATGDKDLAAPQDALVMESEESVSGLLGAKRESFGTGGLGLRGAGEGGGAATLGAAPAGASYGAKSGYVVEKRRAQVVTQPEAPNTEHYTEYGTNAMIASAEDHLSTFSIDVDTASYTIARRKLGEGLLPPAASVRVEEFVNYFDYDYQGPSGDAPFAVNLEAAPHPWEPTHHLVRVGVQGRTLAAGSRPRRLTFLVDVSGSMQSEDKIGLVKQSLHYLVDRLGPEDSIALVTYAGSTRVVLEATPVTRRATIHAAIEALSAGGSTAMASGLGLAYEQASRAYVKGAENRVLVLSDGDANVGPSSYEEILRTVEDYTKQGITLSTLGFGSGNYKDTTMEQIANKGDGNYTYVDSYAEARRVFGEKMGATLDTIARDVKIQVDFDPDAVLAWRLVGYENRDVADRDFRNDKVDAGEVGSGHAVTAVYDVILADDALSRREPLAEVHIRAKKPGPDSPSREWATTLTARAFQSELRESSADLRRAVAAASFAEILRGSRYAQELRYADVWRLAKSAERRGNERDAELAELIARAGYLAGEDGPWTDALSAGR